MQAPWGCQPGGSVACFDDRGDRIRCEPVCRREVRDGTVTQTAHAAVERTGPDGAIAVPIDGEHTVLSESVFLRPRIGVEAAARRSKTGESTATTTNPEFVVVTGDRIYDVGVQTCDGDLPARVVAQPIQSAVDRTCPGPPFFVDVHRTDLSGGQSMRTTQGYERAGAEALQAAVSTHPDVAFAILENRCDGTPRPSAFLVARGVPFGIDANEASFGTNPKISRTVRVEREDLHLTKHGRHAFVRHRAAVPAHHAAVGSNPNVVVTDR